MRSDADATGLPKESPYRALYVAAGEAHGVSPDLLERQGFAESSWNPKALGPVTKYGQALGVAAFAAVRAQTIQDDDRRAEFYKNTMGYDPDTGEMDVSTLAIGALKRSSYMAGPSLAWDTIGTPLGLPYAGLGRTTRDTELDTGERPKAWSALSLPEKVGNFPAMKWATQFGSIPINAANLLRNDLDENQIRRQKEALGLPRDNGRQEAGYRANCLKPFAYSFGER